MSGRQHYRHSGMARERRAYSSAIRTVASSSSPSRRAHRMLLRRPVLALSRQADSANYVFEGTIGGLGRQQPRQLLFQGERARVRLKGERPARARRQRRRTATVGERDSSNRSLLELTSSSPISTARSQIQSTGQRKRISGYDLVHARQQRRPVHNRHRLPDLVDVPIFELKALKLQRNASDADSWSSETHGDGYNASELQVREQAPLIRRRRPRRPKPTRFRQLSLVEERSSDINLGRRDGSTRSLPKRAAASSRLISDDSPAASSVSARSVKTIDVVQQLLHSITAPSRPQAPSQSDAEDSSSDDSNSVRDDDRTTTSSNVCSEGSDSESSCGEQSISGVSEQSGQLLTSSPSDALASSRNKSGLLQNQMLLQVDNRITRLGTENILVLNSEAVIPRTSQRRWAASS